MEFLLARMNIVNLKVDECMFFDYRRFCKTGSFERGRCGRRNPRYVEIQKRLEAMRSANLPMNYQLNDNSIAKNPASAG